MKKRIGLTLVILFISYCMNVTLNAQTPADDPGIGGPGTNGSAPAGDGAPIVPFDGGMSLMLVASGIGYVVKRLWLRESGYEIIVWNKE